MLNPNSVSFWNKKIKRSRQSLSLSPIFAHKNNIVLNKLHKGKVLDIGIGYGFIEMKLSENVNIDLHGIDISDEAIKHAKKNFRGKFKIVKGTSIPFKNIFFDHVLALDVFEHMYINELYKTLREIKRIIKPSGKLIVSVPINESPKDSALNRHVRKYSLNKLETELKHFGFRVKETFFLTAFRRLYKIKSIINNILHLKSPNLLIVIAQKK